MSSEIDWGALYRQACAPSPLRWFAAVGWDEQRVAVPCLYEGVCLDDRLLLVPYSTGGHAYPDQAPVIVNGPLALTDAVEFARFVCATLPARGGGTP